MQEKQEKIKLIEKKKTNEPLQKSTKGINLASNHAKMIWQGNKDLIVKDTNTREAIGKLYYVVGGNDCYSVIKIKDVSQINLKQFKELESRHRITDAERKNWFKNKSLFYAYEFDVVENFGHPKRVPASEGEVFVNNIEFLSDKEEKQYKYPELVEDFVSQIGSSNLVSKLSEPKVFVNKLLDLIKKEPQLLEDKPLIYLFEAINPMKPAKEFDDENKLIAHLFGGG